MKKQLLLLITIIPILSFSQSRKNQFNLTDKSNDYSIYVKLKPETDLNIKSKKINKLSTFFIKNKIEVIANLYDKYNFRKSKKKSFSNIDKNQQSLDILSNIYQIKSNKQSKEELIQLAKELESFNEVDYVSFIGNTPIKPPYYINTSTSTSTTPNLKSYQTYLDSNPGIDAKYAWSIGITGKNVNVINIEYGFNKNHEMLVNLDNVQLEKELKLHPELLNSEGEYFRYLDHGTAVASIIVSNKNNIGLTGTSFDIENYTNYLEWTSKGYDRVDAITRALASAKAGDIVMYEMQTYGENDEYVPAEFENIIWDLTKIATDAGIIVIAAAGNGKQNLDSSFYQSYMNRGDSGAIIVGAGSSNNMHFPLNFSTYGSRVDLQGWGERVLSAGYGNWVKYGNDINRNYTFFSGTSSATPIVASVAILVQSYYFQQTGKYLTPKELKELLIKTGIPQGGDLTKNIGPFPNIKSAIEKLNSDYLTTKDIIPPLVVKLYPNPAKDFLYISNNEKLDLNYQLLDLNGNIVLKGKGKAKDKINISSITKGIYMIKLTDGKRIVVEKIIKE